MTRPGLWLGAGRVASALVLCVLSVGCAVTSPRNVPTDRLEYSEVLADSWKRQTLLNVVRLRYGDAPTFLDVSSIINSYSLSGKAVARVDIPASGGDAFQLGGEATWSNTPTVTYLPLIGARFTTSMLQPISPSAVLRLIQSGWSADLVLRTVVRSVNGLRNGSSGVGPDPLFRELIQTMGRIQSAGGVDMRLMPRADGTAIVLVLPDEADPVLKEERARLIRLLGIAKDATELEIVYGRTGHTDSEIAMITRSMLEIMLELGFSVHLPEAHTTDGSTLPGRGAAGNAAADRLVRIHSGSEAPADAYAAVSYRGQSFWIDGKDIASKSTFTFMLLLFSLAETGQSAAPPLVTVPSR